LQKEIGLKRLQACEDWFSWSKESSGVLWVNNLVKYLWEILHSTPNTSTGQLKNITASLSNILKRAK
jgi:hypothetical protein